MAVHEDCWTRTLPTTSLNAHLVIRGVALAGDPAKSAAAALAIRRAFFQDGRDISLLDVLLDTIASLDVDSETIRHAIACGRAGAALMADYRRADQFMVKGSPSFVLDGGRQTLFGNVGYRVLQANVEELLNQGTGEASWC